MNERKIITRNERPPIPILTYDWVAFREGNEETGPFFWGTTEADAIAELKEYEELGRAEVKEYEHEKHEEEE
jgi:hypothetical protein